MTNEDKKLIADYMGWDGTTTIEGYAIPTPEIHYFDLNDAGLIVKGCHRLTTKEWVICCSKNCPVWKKLKEVKP